MRAQNLQVFQFCQPKSRQRPMNLANGPHLDPMIESMKKLETSGRHISSERPISFGLAERQRAAEAARQAEIANPSVRKLLPELQSTAEDSVQGLIKAFSNLSERHEDTIELESALQLANDAIIQLNNDRTSKPDQLELKKNEARNAARLTADQLHAPTDLEAKVISSLPIAI